MKSIRWWAGKLKIPGAMVLLGFAVMFCGNRIVEQTVRTGDWPSTEGVITVI